MKPVKSLVIVFSLFICGLLITSCSASQKSAAKQYIDEKYGFTPEIIDVDDEYASEWFYQVHDSTVYHMKYDDREFDVICSKDGDFSDNYLWQDVYDEFYTNLESSFDRSELSKMDISLFMKFTDESIATLNDLEKSNCVITVSIFSNGVDSSKWENLDFENLSKKFSIYVSDFISSDYPVRADTEGEVGFSNLNPYEADWVLLNYTMSYEKDDWTLIKIETIEEDGLIISYDCNAVDSIEKINDSSYPTYRITAEYDTEISILINDSDAYLYVNGDDSRRVTSLSMSPFTHHNEYYALKVGINNITDITIVD